mgnify:CR=1 FL=1
MRRIIPFLIIVLLLFWFVLKPDFLLSETQKDTVDALGYPTNFAISYMPTGDEEKPTLTRNEVWYYPTHNLKIIFSAGKVFETEEYTPTTTKQEPTKLKPQNFHFNQSFASIKRHLKSKPYEFESFAEEDDYDIKTYVSEDAFFTIENGKLTYFQTFSIEYEK